MNESDSDAILQAVRRYPEVIEATDKYQTLQVFAVELRAEYEAIELMGQELDRQQIETSTAVQHIENLAASQPESTADMRQRLVEVRTKQTNIQQRLDKLRETVERQRIRAEDVEQQASMARERLMEIAKRTIQEEQATRALDTD